MSAEEMRCSILSYLIAKHAYSSPKPKDQVVNLAGLRNDQIGDAKDVFEDLRTYSFIDDCGKRGIKLNNSEFGDLVDYLYHNCGYDESELRIRFKHYEGWPNHEWTAE